jgi:hypothetical protein
MNLSLNSGSKNKIYTFFYCRYEFRLSQWFSAGVDLFLVTAPCAGELYCQNFVHPYSDYPVVPANTCGTTNLRFPWL